MKLFIIAWAIIANVVWAVQIGRNDPLSLIRLGGTTTVTSDSGNPNTHAHKTGYNDALKYWVNYMSVRRSNPKTVPKSPYRFKDRLGWRRKTIESRLKTGVRWTKPPDHLRSQVLSDQTNNTTLYRKRITEDKTTQGVSRKTANPIIPERRRSRVPGISIAVTQETSDLTVVTKSVDRNSGDTYDRSNISIKSLLIAPNSTLYGQSNFASDTYVAYTQKPTKIEIHLGVTQETLPPRTGNVKESRGAKNMVKFRLDLERSTQRKLSDGPEKLKRYTNDSKVHDNPTDTPFNNTVINDVIDTLFELIAPEDLLNNQTVSNIRVTNTTGFTKNLRITPTSPVESTAKATRRETVNNKVIPISRPITANDLPLSSSTIGSRIPNILSATYVGTLTADRFETHNVKNKNRTTYTPKPHVYPMKPSIEPVIPSDRVSPSKLNANKPSHENPTSLLNRVQANNPLGVVPWPNYKPSYQFPQNAVSRTPESPYNLQQSGIVKTIEINQTSYQPNTTGLHGFKEQTKPMTKAQNCAVYFRPDPYYVNVYWQWHISQWTRFACPHSNHIWNQLNCVCETNTSKQTLPLTGQTY